MNLRTRVIFLLGLGACSGDKDGSWFDTGSSAGGSSQTAPAPPEDEESGELLLLPPAQTDRYVFVANPLRDTVSRIEVSTLSVLTAPVGSRPSLVLTTPDHARAVVFNEGDDSVTLLDAVTLGAQSVAVRPHLNAMALSPDGQWAVLWRDSSRAEGQDEPEGLLAFNEASFVRTSDGAHSPMAVGFEPQMVQFTPDGRLAVIVSQAELAVVELGAQVLSPRLYELAPGELDPPRAEEVLVDPAGELVWVRPFGATELLVVELDTGLVQPVPAGDNPTDLDLSPDGQWAVAVARDSAELWVYEVGSPFAPPRVVPLPPDAGYGSLQFAPGAGVAVLYTTATARERFALWDLATDEIVERSLVKPVSAVAVTPTGGSLLVFHSAEDGPETEPLFLGKPALTLIDLSDLRSNPLLLPGEPSAYANSTSGLRGYFVMEGEPFLEVLDYVTLLHDQHRLPSTPEFLGVLPDLAPEDGDEPVAWVSQEHELGRLSFFDPDDASMETITGFELNAGIEP
jgi:DNA-binding beta-propeller fold protein YncE